eukprot:1296859-Amphidinium_carterae.1
MAHGWSARFKGVPALTPSHPACLTPVQRLLVHMLRFVGHRGADLHVGSNTTWQPPRAGYHSFEAG